MKHILMVVLLAGALVTHAQSPFSGYKGRDIYFLSIDELAGDSTCSITTIDSMNSTGGMNEFWDIDVLTISRNGGSDYWFIPSRFVSKNGRRYPDGEPAYDDFLNGIEWQTEDGQIISSGFVGYGTGCRNDYYYDSTFTRVVKTEHCKFDTVECVRSVTVFSGGRPSFIVKPGNLCYSMDNDPEDHPLPLYGSVTGDTTVLVYDPKGTLRGMRMKDTIVPLFDTDPGDIPAPSTYHRTMINGITFEKFVDQKIKFRPRLILVEMWNYGVYIYRYDQTTKKYYADQEWELY